MNRKLLRTLAVTGLALGQYVSLAESQVNHASSDKAGYGQPLTTDSNLLTGRIAVEGGGSTQPPDATVVLECDGSEPSRVTTRLDGSFTLDHSNYQGSYIDKPGSYGLSPPIRSVAFCSLYADAPGYSSERLFISADQQITDVGTIMLHPAKGQAPAESATVSVGTLAAPPAAKKAFEKGNQQAKKKNWQLACEYFHRAIDIYPRYAVAWLELGRAQIQQQALPDAQQSFQRAIAEDSHFVPGYLELTNVAAKQKDWTLVASTTDHLAQLAPDLSPKLWFFNSVAQMNLGNISQATKGATRGLRLDVRHEVPQLEYLYGMLLAKEGNYAAAVEHIRRYLQLSPHAADAGSAQGTLSRVERLASEGPQHATR